MKRGIYFAYLRQRNPMVEGWRWWHSLVNFGRRCAAPPTVLRWWELAQQTPHVPLLLLHATIAPDNDELNSHRKNSLVERVWFGRKKFEQHRWLFIGLLAPNHSRRGDLVNPIFNSMILFEILGKIRKGIKLYGMSSYPSWTPCPGLG
jgi:hypothetical protein